MQASLLSFIKKTKGFMPEHEGQALYRAALEVAPLGPMLEIGSYCGKSTLYLAHACSQHDSVVYALDHHRGSEEHQKGEGYHDAELYSEQEQKMNSFTEFRKNIESAQLENFVIPIVAPSTVAAKHWKTPLAMVFIDGGHSEQAAQNDYNYWASHVISGGLLAIHDIYEDPEKGGQAPYHIYQKALASGKFEDFSREDTLVFLKRI